MRTNQLHFKTRQTALAICVLKLWPILPKHAVPGYCEFNARVAIVPPAIRLQRARQSILRAVWRLPH